MSLMVATADIAWLAGLMEGEASFSTTPAGRGTGVRVSMKSTDEDVVRRAAAVCGYGTVNGPYAPSAGNVGKKPYWTWSVHKQPEAAGLMMTIFPYLGHRRQERVTELLHIWRSRPSLRFHCRNGHPKPTPGRCDDCKTLWLARQNEVVA